MTFDPKSMATKSSQNKGARRNTIPAEPEKPSNDPPAAEVGSDASEKPTLSSADPAGQVETTRSLDSASVLIEVPFGELLPGYVASRLDLTLTNRQASACKHLWCTLSAFGERATGTGGSHPVGKIVDSPAMGVRWLLDRIADAIEKETNESITSDPTQLYRV